MHVCSKKKACAVLCGISNEAVLRVFITRVVSGLHHTRLARTSIHHAASGINFFHQLSRIIRLVHMCGNFGIGRG